MKIYSFNARNGDATYIRSNEGINIIVDMGYSETYTDYISSKITEIGEKDENIDLIVITHIDHDHISGAISFLKDISNSVYKKDILKQIWHNSYRHLSMATSSEMSIGDRNVLRAFLGKSSTYSFRSKETEISALQGSTLAGQILKTGVEWNDKCSNKAIQRGNATIVGDLAIRVLLPKEDILNKLKFYWRNQMRKLKHDFTFTENEMFDDAYEFYLLNEADVTTIAPISAESANTFKKLLRNGTIIKSQKDNSITNASSIVTIIESQDHKILLTGDAHDDDLTNVLLEQIENGIKMDFDLVKLPHHGSKKNNCKWLELISSKYYLVSTDASTHNHPDIEAIINIILSNPTKRKTICFNNNLKILNQIDDRELKSKYNYSIMRPNRDWGIKIEF
ncbi:MAG: MBL fold metallo-hydrolase [Bacteroidales bacterium]|nr:MBL fold metallo-hydrolase [Bacteroidales bacterium]